MKQMSRAGLMVGFFLMAGLAVAQPDVLEPLTWFESLAAVIAIGGILAGAITRALTALGKDWFGTTGLDTVILSGGISVIVAGVGGYHALGTFADLTGWQGALSAAFMALWAVVQANAGHKVGAHTQAAALKRAGLVQPGSIAGAELAEEKTKSVTK